MRAAFYEYYGLSEKEIEKLWKEGLIVFDTNVLLKFYQLSNDSQKEILLAMEGYKDRLWLPHQVGYEYHERRLEKASAPIEALRGLERKIDDFENSIKSNYFGNPYIDYKKLESAFKAFKKRVSKLASAWLNNCPNPIREDTILESLTRLFDGKVGNEYDEAKLATIYQEGNERYSMSIPPGYKDTGKPGGDRHRFGDFIIWLQIIEQSNTADKDIIFVTDDCKEDWWSSYKDDKLGPRRELIREFRKETNNHVIWFYTTGRFLKTAKTRLGAQVKPKTIDEVKRQALDWASIMNIASMSRPISWNSLGLQHRFDLDESDSYDIGKTSKSIDSALSMYKSITKPLISSNDIMMSKDLSISPAEDTSKNAPDNQKSEGDMSNDDKLNDEERKGK